MAKAKKEDELEFKAVTTIAEQDILFKALYPLRIGEMKRKDKDRLYFDTEDLSLYHSPLEIAWRTQFNEGEGTGTGSYWQTLKYKIKQRKKLAQGMTFRVESKSKIKSLLPSFKRLPKQDRLIVSPYMDPDEALEYKFTASVPRRYFNIEAGRKKKPVEVAFDRGFIIIPSLNLVDPVVGIELESDSASAILAIRDMMGEILGHPLRVDPYPSKGAQGMEFYKKNMYKK